MMHQLAEAGVQRADEPCNPARALTANLCAVRQADEYGVLGKVQHMSMQYARVQLQHEA